MTEPRSAVVHRASGPDLMVDIHAPIGASLRSAVILLHGGGWIAGHRGDLAPQAAALARHGFTAISADYRLSGEAVWPAQRRDVEDVLAWAKGAADALGFEADKVALFGCSAGGHLALMAAGDAAAVVAIGAPPELHLPAAAAGFDPVAALLGPGATAATARAASPIQHVGAGLPPICLIGSTADRLVPPGDLIAYFSALEAAGVAVALHLHHGHAHAFDALPSMLEPVMAEAALFLKRAMVDPAHYVAESEALNPFARGLIPAPQAALS